MIGRAMATTRVGAGWRELGNGSSSQAAALEVRIAEALDCAPSVLGVALASLAHPSPPDDLEAAEASLEHLAELALDLGKGALHVPWLSHVALDRQHAGPR
jgi:hypothetical protein